MLSLDEAITHAMEVAEKSEEAAKTFGDKDDCNMKDDCLECASEHRQLAEWLRELKKWRTVRNRLSQNRITTSMYGDVVYGDVVMWNDIKRVIEEVETDEK